MTHQLKSVFIYKWVLVFRDHFGSYFGYFDIIITLKGVLKWDWNRYISKHIVWYLIWKHSSWRESNLKFKDHFWLLLWCYDVIFTQNRGWMEFKLKMGICYKAYHMMHHSTELFVLNQFMTFRDHFRVTLVTMTQCLIQVNLVTDHQCVNLGHNWERKALITVCFSVFYL